MVSVPEGALGKTQGVAKKDSISLTLKSHLCKSNHPDANQLAHHPHQNQQSTIYKP